MANLPVEAPQASASSSSSSSSTSLPPRQALLRNLTTQSVLLSQLFTILSASSATQNSNIQQIYTGLQLSTLDLSNLVKDAYAHQAEYAKLLEKRARVEQLEGRVRGLIKGLENDRLELERLVEGGKKIKEGIEQSEKHPAHVPTLLAHSQRLARYSSAPISSLMSDVDKNQFQPWPNETMMRMGLLFQMGGNEGMGGMGKKGNLGDETQASETIVEQPQSAVVHEEPARRYDPNAVFTLDLNSDDSDDD
ncbi:uncharacterized protein I303_106618 [Kwoniella dejecticola CBS 10117]|uniref:Mediator of RNA polymerase II transcription subunit 4 n=1 Tax=Kwoniella dejecticola CBS 10117 TaxID=1296121 RepID=A0A1A5ZU72_9TREE|nr:uncharacterized protein I303_08123 [Kwoniella dejecticola CBS 10117]OBR81353.1 hypothetical protein I303_08123 [Kwoniella dejecticola CBS 10117]